VFIRGSLAVRAGRDAVCRNKNGFRKGFAPLASFGVGFFRPAPWFQFALVSARHCDGCRVGHWHKLHITSDLSRVSISYGQCESALVCAGLTSTTWPAWKAPSVSSPQPPGRSLPLGASPVLATNIRPPRFIGRCATVAYPGKRAGKELVYMGKVGTGWSTVSSQIRKQLDIVVSPKSKLTKPIKKPNTKWVEPKFSGKIEYRDITSEVLLRRSSFKALK